MSSWVLLGVRCVVLRRRVSGMARAATAHGAVGRGLVGALRWWGATVVS